MEQNNCIMISTLCQYICSNFNVNNKLERISIRWKLAIQSITMGIMIFAGGVIAKYSWETVYYVQGLAMFISMLMLVKITKLEKKNFTLNKNNGQKNFNRWKNYIKYDSKIVFLMFVLGFSICDGVFVDIII